jgi:hypothetical protein
MSQAVIIALAFWAVALGIAAAALEATIWAVAKFHFGVEKGVRNPEGRRRFKEFQLYCWKTYGFGSAAYSLQDFKGPPYNWLTDFSGVVTPVQVFLALVAAAFLMAAVNRFREPFAY